MNHHRYTPSPDVHLCRDASPSSTWSPSQCSCDQQSSSSGSTRSGRKYDRAVMSEEWTHRPRQQQDPDKYMKRQRWSTYTADTSSTALESGNEETTYTRHGRKISCDDSATLLDVSERDDDDDGHDDDDDGSMLPSVEDKLNAALVSMLSTANGLLISTMTARSDLARLQMMESALDEQLDRREEAIMLEIKNNEKMMQWMEKASEKLDRVLLETKSYTPSTSAATWSKGGLGEGSPRHWRAPSTVGQVSSLETVSSLGVFEAKNDSSTINKSAAKRLEKVLRRASSTSNGITTLPPRSEGSTAKEQAENSVTLPKQTERADLAIRLGMTSSSTLGPASAPAPKLALPTVPSTSVASFTAPAPSPSLDSETSEFRARTPSITSESGPSSMVSSRDDTNVSASAIQVLLTPQTPHEELPYLTTSPVNDDTRNPLNKRSISSLRSPYPIRASRHMSSGPNVSEATLNRLSWQQEDGEPSSKAPSQMLGSRGAALESLRKLNGGSSFGQTGTPSPSPGWGGALASWVGMSSPGQ